MISYRCRLVSILDLAWARGSGDGDCGFLNKQIAVDLWLSEIVVKVHRLHLTEKIEVGSLSDLAHTVDRVRRTRKISRAL
jgi:DNA-binding NarL/FixJ family response regulator